MNWGRECPVPLTKMNSSGLRYGESVGILLNGVRGPRYRGRRRRLPTRTRARLTDNNMRHLLAVRREHTPLQGGLA
jgi:hypothetical protein